MITLDRLVKRYGNISAVNNLSLTVPAGQIFGFIGPNGAGKTTTIEMLRQKASLADAHLEEIFIKLTSGIANA